MPNAFTPFTGKAPASVANYTTPAGQRVQNGAAPTNGTPYFASAPLVSNGRGGAQTPHGDVFNPFKGYVSPEGGTFGSGGLSNQFGPNGLDSYGRDPLGAARAAFESVTGVSADRLGLGTDATAADYDQYRQKFGGIANGDTQTLNDALASSNDLLARTALAYQRGYGSSGVSDDEFAAWKAGGRGAVAAPSGTQAIDYASPGGVPAGDAPPTDPAADPGVLPDLLSTTRAQMIPSTTNPPQTPQAQGPNPLIPFYSGQQPGFGAGPDYASSGPQAGVGFYGADVAAPEQALQSQLRTGPGPGGPTDIGGGKPVPGDTAFTGRGGAQTGGALPLSGSAGAFGGAFPAGGGSGTRGGSSPFGFPRYVPVGFPSGRDPRKRRARPEESDLPYAPMAEIAF